MLDNLADNPVGFARRIVDAALGSALAVAILGFVLRSQFDHLLKRRLAKFTADLADQQSRVAQVREAMVALHGMAVDAQIEVKNREDHKAGTAIAGYLRCADQNGPLLEEQLWQSISETNRELLEAQNRLRVLPRDLGPFHPMTSEEFEKRGKKEASLRQQHDEQWRLLDRILTDISATLRDAIKKDFKKNA